MTWKQWPTLALAAGVLLVWACALAERDAWGLWRYILLAGGALALAGAWGLRRLGAVPSEVTAALEQLAQDQQRVAEQREQLLGLQQAVATEWEQQSVTFGRREQALTDRLNVFQEWLEFPEPVDLSQPVKTDEELHELARKDRLLIELLQREAERAFDDILKNKYAPDGKFRPLVLRDDVYDLIRRVARIYRPEAEQPLLETNLERVFRAASRACLQFLVVLDELPLNVPKHDLNSIYAYVRQAVKAYGVYKSAEPYFPYLSSAYYLGRFAMGASPVSLGAWWFVGRLGTRGARTFVTRLVNRQGLVLLHNAIRVIGFEVASMYSEDFRYRGANWIYAAELTELASGLPLSREGLAAALQELGVMQLRSEYDRVYLYRCLAEHRSAQPERYRAAVVLTVEERQAIAARLERFLKSSVEERPPKALERWQRGAELRLDVKLSIGMTAAQLTDEEQVAEALHSLASFLLEVKEQEADKLPEILAATALARRLSEERRVQLWQQLQENPPFFFQPPDLDPAGKLPGVYLEDLVALAIRTPPHHAAVEDVLAEVAGYLRQDGKALCKRVQQEYVHFLADRLPPDAPGKSLPAEVARAVLDLLGADEQPRFVYAGVTFPQAQESEARSCPKGKTWLLGVRDRLVAFTVAEGPKLVWEGDATVRVQCVPGYVIKDCALTGGRWLVAEPSALPTVRIAGLALTKYEKYFAPLVGFCQGGES